MLGVGHSEALMCGMQADYRPWSPVVGYLHQHHTVALQGKCLSSTYSITAHWDVRLTIKAQTSLNFSPSFIST